jgi:perosamine synthetase
MNKIEHPTTIQMAGPWITQHEIDTVTQCMQSGWYNYDYVETFEREFAAYHGRKHAIMTTNCTAAIHLLLTALGIADGDEVIVPECTWIASAAPIGYLRATPVFADIDATHWCIDPQSIEERITPRTKAIIAVDLFGNMPDMTTLQALCAKHKLHLIEDAAEALGSTYHGKKAGSFGAGSVFSFHRTKTLVTGEGGMLLVDDDALAGECRMLRDHGRRPTTVPYFNEEVAYKYMPFNLQAAMGYAQFERLPELIAKKREIFESYRAQLSDIPDLHFNPDGDGVFNSAWITGVVFGESHRLTKADAMAGLQQLGVPSRPFFYPLTSIPAYAEYRAAYAGRNPVAYDVSNRGINLPGALIMTQEQIDQVCTAMRTMLTAKTSRGAA